MSFQPTIVNLLTSFPRSGRNESFFDTSVLHKFRMSRFTMRCPIAESQNW